MKIGYLRQDDDCHWYLVPEESIGEFDELSERCESAWGWGLELLNRQMDELFGDCRIDHPYDVKVVVE